MLFSRAAATLLASVASVSIVVVRAVPGSVKSVDSLGFDIYGDSQILSPSHKVSVDKDCNYHAEVRVNFRDAAVPFAGDLAEDCNFDPNCNGQSCLFEVRNVYGFTSNFEKITGFNHVGLDWSPCGHKPIAYFGTPHWNMHIFYVTPDDRLNTQCTMAPDFPNSKFICAYPIEAQSEFDGRKYFVWGTDSSGEIANIPVGASPHLNTAVPGEGVHVWDQDDAAPAADWFDPLLITGLYDGGIQFWEPMFPYTFVSGDTGNFYEKDMTYVSQTKKELPSYWSMEYDPDDGFTTLIMKGKAKVCSFEKV